MLAGIDILGIAVVTGVIAAVVMTWWILGDQDWRDALVDEESREATRAGGNVSGGEGSTARRLDTHDNGPRRTDRQEPQ